MVSHKTIIALLLLIFVASYGSAQDGRTKGGIKGKVRDEKGAAVADASVVARQGEREVARATTDHKGEFLMTGLEPGNYGFTFRKAGLSTGTLENIEVRAGKVRSLSGRVVLRVDEGSIAFLRGSVFTPEGRSVAGARVELARLEPDGTAKKMDGRITNETGQFVFRLTPDAAKYRISVRAEGAEPASKDVEVDGAAVYRIAVSLRPAQK